MFYIKNIEFILIENVIFQLIIFLERFLLELCNKAMQHRHYAKKVGLDPLWIGGMV